MNEVSDYYVAGLCFRLQIMHSYVVPDNLMPFLGGGGNPDWVIQFEEIAKLPDLPSKEAYQSYFFSVRESGGKYLRYYHVHAECDRTYATLQCNWDTGQAVVRCLKGEWKTLWNLNGYFAHIGFEELLMSRDRMILHASLIDSSFGGILFSGPSGVGKSTQADLWRKYEDSAIINGDRPIMNKSAEGWLAHGSPYAGSSKYYVNKSVPVAAIVMLEQGSECEIRRLPMSEAFRRLYAQTVINSWNERYVTKACDLLMDLAASVPVYHMVCTPDRTAVETLKSVL